MVVGVRGGGTTRGMTGGGGEMKMTDGLGMTGRVEGRLMDLINRDVMTGTLKQGAGDVMTKKIKTDIVRATKIKVAGGAIVMQMATGIDIEIEIENGNGSVGQLEMMTIPDGGTEIAMVEMEIDAMTIGGGVKAP